MTLQTNVYNYAEFEPLDRLFGTLHPTDPEKDKDRDRDQRKDRDRCRERLASRDE